MYVNLWKHLILPACNNLLYVPSVQVLLVTGYKNKCVFLHIQDIQHCASAVFENKVS